jgi:hypothetical protein
MTHFEWSNIEIHSPVQPSVFKLKSHVENRSPALPRMPAKPCEAHTVQPSVFKLKPVVLQSKWSNIEIHSPVQPSVLDR